MSEMEKLLDSRRHEGDSEWGYYLLELDDAEAIESSPFRHSLEALREFGFDKVEITHPTYPLMEDDRCVSIETKEREWEVTALRKFPDTENMIADWSGGALVELSAEINSEGERELSAGIGASGFESFAPNYLHEMIWGHLEVIHKSLRGSFIGHRLPIIGNNEL